MRLNQEDYSSHFGSGSIRKDGGFSSQEVPYASHGSDMQDFEAIYFNKIYKEIRNSKRLLNKFKKVFKGM